MQTLELNKMGLTPMHPCELLERNGGMTVEQLLWAAWVNTPDGGSSFWNNDGAGYFEGTICYNGGCPGTGGIDTNTGQYWSRWPGI